MTEQQRNQAIVQDLLRYDPCPQLHQPRRASNLDSWDLPREAGDFLLQEPNAFLFGCLFNYQWPYVKALSAPLELCRRLGHLDAPRLALMCWEELAPFLGKRQHGVSLHRYPNNVSKRIVAASRKLLTDYGGCAANIWPNESRASEVIARLRAFQGISQKISNMMARLLVRAFGVQLTNWEEIDIAVDRHVARVFLRTGLVPRPDGHYTVADVSAEVIAAARLALPMFPGHLDGASFSIGLEWCTAERAYCDWEQAPCPLRNTCRRRTGLHIHEQRVAATASCN
jgi:endonuclease III